MSVTGADLNLKNQGSNVTTTPEKYTTIDELLEYNKPDNRDLLIKTYGDQGITGFLKLTGAVNSAGAADHVQYWEEDRRHLVAEAGAVGTATSNAIELDGGLKVSDATGYNNTKDGIVVHKQDVVMRASTGERFICTNDAGTAFVTLDGTAAASDWAANDQFIILGNMYGQGSDHPDHFIKTEPVLRKNPYMIIKDTYQVNGSQATNIGWVNLGGGDYRWYIHGEQETRARFMDRREMMLLFAQKMDGATTTIGAAGAPVSGSEGYFEAVESRGIVTTDPFDSTNNGFTDMDALIVEFDKQGAPNEYAMYVNRAQSLKIDDMLAAGPLGTAGNFTAGLPAQFGAFNNSADMAVQLGFKSFTRGGYTFHKHDWKLLNDPTLLGAQAKYVGAMVPMVKVADPVTGGKAHALEMNYKSVNGYSRELEHWVRGGGVLGHNQLSKDVAEFNYRSEINLITRAANQHVVIKS
jgi:hypothetical protein